MSKKIEVIVVDDHPMVRRGIVSTLAEDPGFTVIGEGASCGDALELVAAKRPKLAMLDVTMPGGGIEAAAEITKAYPGTAVVMLSIREELATVRAAFRAGAHGYISKGVSGPDLIGAARLVVAGERYVSPALAARLIADDAGEPTAPAGGVTLRSALTAREREIFELLGQGLSNAEIGQRISLSENTVKHYMTPLLHKLGVRNRTEAALLARKHDGTKRAD